MGYPGILIPVDHAIYPIVTNPLLPVLAQIFQCSVDEIIMPAYFFDMDLEEKKIDKMDWRARQFYYNKTSSRKTYSKQQHVLTYGLPDSVFFSITNDIGLWGIVITCSGTDIPVFC